MQRTALSPLPLLLFATTFAAALPAQAQPAGQSPGDGEAIERLKQADTNHDGAISRAELIAFRKTQWTRMDRNHDGYFSQDDLPGFVRSRWDGDKLVQLRKQFDKNHDGKLSYAEFVNGPTIGFDMADTDGNGVVTQAELDAAIAAIKARRG